MSAEGATYAEGQRWQTISDKVFGADNLSNKQKAAAWKQLCQQSLPLVEELLDVSSEQLTAVLLNEIPGECWHCAGVMFGTVVA